MNARNIVYQGPDINDQALLHSLPLDYGEILQNINGFIQYDGGLHIRGICSEPLWHSLSYVWRGDYALSQAYTAVMDTDIPFGQDALGDQFLLRDGVVQRLFAETGELESLECDLQSFLKRAQASPVDYLSLQPLVQFFSEGGQLQPGQLISVYPPFCTKEAANGVSLRAIPALERLAFLADFARRIADISDNQQIQIARHSSDTLD